MKKFTVFTFCVICTAMLYGQPRPDFGVQPRSREASANEGIAYYTLSGMRHGVNYFPKVRHPNVQYETGEKLLFDNYHSLDVIYDWLEIWAERYSDLVELYEVGRSYEGRPIMQITVTNRKTGRDTDKPAAFFEGGRHSGEVTASETVMWLAQYLLENYGKDPDITHLLDKRAIYLRPVNNPDGHNLYMHTAQSNRSTVRPFDNDGDGLLDEDPPDDLNSDGIIHTMRWKDEKNGNLIPDPGDPSGRIMKRVAPGEGIYLSSTEGIDNDGDGRINEDGIGGLDLHRNYPENWRPHTEETGRGYRQGGAGEYPLSEPETRSVVAFLLSHPNIYVVNSMDTSVPMHLRPPSTSGSEERMYPEDLKWYRYFDELGKKITGYARAGDVYNDYGGGNPLFGHGPDFGYWYYGAVWYGDEIWNSGRFGDLNGDGLTDQIDMLIWDEKENEGEGFKDWEKIMHPDLGEVEIGGFDPKFFLQNPPARHLETWIRNQALFNIEMAGHLPELTWENIETKKIRSYKTDSADYQVKVSFKNSGKLPTAFKQAYLVKIVTRDRIVLELDTAGTSGGSLPYRILPDTGKKAGREGRDRNQPGSRLQPAGPVSRDVPFTDGGEVCTGVFNIRLYKKDELAGRASVYSTRGGVLKDRDFIIR